MITYEEALAKILANASALPPERLSINRMLGRGLAEPLIAKFDQPRFDNSSVDGFGVKVEDLGHATELAPVKLKLIDTIKAGQCSNLCLVSGQIVKLSTGSFVPAGVEAVIMREFCFEEKSTVKVTRSVTPGENIRRQAPNLNADKKYCRLGYALAHP